MESILLRVFGTVFDEFRCACPVLVDPRARLLEIERKGVFGHLRCTLCGAEAKTQWVRLPQGGGDGGGV